MRISKDPEERRSEILDTAERLFTVKGYSQTAMMDIANEIGIAKGTLYYHYTSKEEVMEAIILRTLTGRVERAKQLIADTNMKAVDKLFLMLSGQNSDESKRQEDELAEQFHQPENSEMHQKSMKQVILLMAPVLAEVVKQGVDDKIFSTEYPLESVEVLLASSSILFDKEMFHWTEEESKRKARAFVSAIERILGAEKGCFDDILQLINS